MKKLCCKELREIFSRVRTSISEESFLLVSLNRGDCGLIGKELSRFQHFFSITLEEKESTLIVSEEDWSRVSSLVEAFKLQGPFKLIDFGLELDLNTIGFLAEVTRILAEEGISVLALSTYKRDYLLVKTPDAEQAMKALQSFLTKCKNGAK